MRVWWVVLLIVSGLAPLFPLTAQEEARESTLSRQFDPLRIDPRLMAPPPRPVAPPFWQEVDAQWERLSEVGPGQQAVVSLADGTIRGGRILEVLPGALRMESGGQVFEIPRSDMVVVRVQRKNYTVAGGVVGFLVSGLGWMAYLCGGGDDCGAAGALLVFTLLGAPGGLVGALIGSQAGGDVEFIF